MFTEDVALSKIAAEVGTPVYIYSLNGDEYAVIQSRPSIEDILKTESLPDWLEDEL